MRNPLLPLWLPEVQYGIRQIVNKGFERETLGYPVIWENIGDPVQKGMLLPEWIREIITRQFQDNATFGYCDSKGIPHTRDFLAAKTNALGGCQITPDDITFFNGLGDAIARFYSILSREERILMPSPTYPAHTGAERLRIGENPLHYTLHPDNNWLPDPDEIREMVEIHPAVSAILIINPDNPTGMVYPKSILSEIVKIAREYDLFIIADEIYENLVYQGKMVRLAEVIEDVPAMAMKGISKEIPWPGSRCGWIEYYNQSRDTEFENLCKRMDQCKMTEVCSTTLPQKVIPEIMSDTAYVQFLNRRNEDLAQKMNLLKSRLKYLDDVECSGGQGAFYATLHFNTDFVKEDVNSESLPDLQRSLYQKWTSGLDASPDLYLTYYLLAGAGVCTVPLSGFDGKVYGIRITLLEQNLELFDYMLDQLLYGLDTVFSRKSSLIQS
ncbi:pyridoxal phosphate-dependent aminotransferase [soil metagenome]